MNFYYTIRIYLRIIFLFSISLWKMVLNCSIPHIINRISESVLNQIILVFVVSSSIEFETYFSQTIIYITPHGCITIYLKQLYSQASQFVSTLFKFLRFNCTGNSYALLELQRSFVLFSLKMSDDDSSSLVYSRHKQDLV